MAITPKGQRASMTDATEQTTATPRTGGTVVDITNPNLARGRKSTLDPTEDAWAWAAPPFKGCYEIQCFPAREFTKKFYLDEKNPNEDEVFYGVSIEAKLTDPNYKGVTVFPNLSTRLGRGKNISTAAGWIKRMGYKVPEVADDLDIARMAAAVVKNELVTAVDLDWRAYSKLEDRNVHSTMDTFPVDPETGEPMHIFSHRTKSGQIEEIRAQVVVAHWYERKGQHPAYGPLPLGKPKAKTAGKAAPAPATVTVVPTPGAAVQQVVMQEETQGRPNGPAPAQAQPAPAAAVQVEQLSPDLAAMLEEE